MEDLIGSTGVDLNISSGKIKNISIFIIFTFILVAAIFSVLAGLLYFFKYSPCADTREELGLVKSGIYEHSNRGVTTWGVNVCLLESITKTDAGYETKMGLKKNSIQLEIFDVIIGNKDSKVSVCATSKDSHQYDCAIKHAQEVSEIFDGYRNKILSADILIADGDKGITFGSEQTSEYADFIEKFKAFLLEGKRIGKDKLKLRAIQINLK